VAELLEGQEPPLPAAPLPGSRPLPGGRLAGWVADRTGLGSLAAFVRSQGEKLVPAHLPWVYTTGTLALFYFALQVLTGFLLVMYYVPDEKLALASLRRIEHDVPLGWLVRQMHAWGANFIVIVLGIHILKVLWFGSYKKPREFTWFVGFLLLSLTLGFCLSGYLLPWNQLAFWATRVAVDAVDSVPGIGASLKSLICGGPDVSGRTLGRFFALHVILLPGILLALLGAHLALVVRHGIAPRTSTLEEERLGHERAVKLHGAETFFPKQVYKELIFLNVGFALLVTVAVFFPWEIGEPQSLVTPEGIKPEWYFLPLYQLLKYFDDSLYHAIPGLEAVTKALGITPEFLGLLVINGIGLILFLLPLLDRRPERRISRRPLFAAFALVLLLGLLALGVLGYFAERTVTIGGRSYKFTSKGYPVLIEAPPAPETPTTLPGTPTTLPGTPATPPAPDAAAAAALAGTCGNSGCHEKQRDEWATSVHAAHQVRCKDCHGGVDTKLEALPEGIDAEKAAHLGIKTKRSGDPRPPTRAEIPALCGTCHQGVIDAFSPLHLEKSPEEHPKRSCINCHSNHTVLEAGEETYAKGYSDPADPRTKPFAAARIAFSELGSEISASRAALADLEKREFAVEAAAKELDGAQKKLDGMRPLVHALDEARLATAVTPLREDLQTIRKDIDKRAGSEDGRWKLVAGVWVGAVLLSVLLGMQMRRLTGEGTERGEESEEKGESGEGGGGGAGNGTGTERDTDAGGLTNPFPSDPPA